ncbi:MAG TPA: AAA family ATPase [Noviherbaspirillum sp.]
MTEPNRLESLTLHHVGVFDDVRIDFRPIEKPEQDEKKAEIHLFTGPNGCGKSTLLYALANIFDANWKHGLIQNRFRDKESRVDFLFCGAAGVYGVATPSKNEGPYGAFELYINTPEQGCIWGGAQFQQGIIANARHQHRDDSIKSIYNYKGNIRSFQPSNRHAQIKFSFAAFAYSGQRTLNTVPIGAIQEITNSPFENAVSFDNTVRPQVLLQWIANNRAQAALARSDGDTAAADRYDLALRRISDVIRNICDLDVEFRLERAPLSVSLRIDGEPIQFGTLPDGLKSIISWIADLSMRLEAIPWEVERDVFAQPILLFLDEIDIHLHPKWQRRILPAVQALLPNAQIFVSTHSPFVVGSVEDAWVYRLSETATSETNGPRLISGLPSGAGKSYRLILEEIFGVDEEFDVETEKLLDDFYAVRNFVLQDQSKDGELLQIGAKIAERGEEAKVIIERELRQISRLTRREIRLA